MSTCPADGRPCDKVPCPLACGAPPPTPSISILDKLTSFEPSAERDRWWAERWLKSATLGERAAMKELLS